MDNKITNPKPLSEEDKKKLEGIRNQNTEYLKDQLPHLKVQAEYAQLKASIVENTYKESYYKIKMAEMKMSIKDSEKQEKPPKP
jgi:hypothetical protein